MTETAKERLMRGLEEVIDFETKVMKINEINPAVNKTIQIAVSAITESNRLPASSGSTNKLSVEKLEPIGYYNEAHGFLHDEFDKDCYCQGGCSMEAVYTESQVKKLTGENKVEKLQEELESCIQILIEASVAATITQDIVVGNLVDRKLADLAKTHKLAVDYIEKVTGKNIDVVLAENAAIEAEEENE